MTNFFLRSWIKKGWEYFNPAHSWEFSKDIVFLAVSLFFYIVSFLSVATTYIFLPLTVCMGFGLYRFFRQGKQPIQAFNLFICLIALISTFTNSTGHREAAFAFFPTATAFALVLGTDPALLFLLYIGTLLAALSNADGIFQGTAYFTAISASCLPIAWISYRQTNKDDELERVVREIRSDINAIDSLDETDNRPFLEKDRFTELINSVTEIKRNLDEIIFFVKNAIPCNTAVYFSVSSDSIFLKSYISDTPPLSLEPVQPGRGYLGIIATEKRKVRIDKISTERLKPVYYKNNVPIESFLGIPVMESNIVLGILAVDSTEENAFSDRDMDLLTLVARQITGYLRKAKVYKEIGETAHAFKALYDISSNVLGNIKLTEVPHELVAASNRIVVADLCALLIKKRGKYEVMAIRGIDIKKRKVFSGKDSILGWISQHSQPYLVSDLKTRPVNVLPFSVPGLRSFIGLPLLFEGRCLGIFVLGSQQPNIFNAKITEMLKMLASQAAISIANAELHEKIERMAITDGLTGLFNHQYFQSRLTGQFERISRFPDVLSFLLMDIDFFKKVNDTYGHPAGDAVLKGVARLIKRTLRTVDIPARYGGEEFAAILIKTNQKGARKMAERLRKAIETETFKTEWGDLKVTLSIGISTFPDDAQEKEEIIEKADQALYYAKSAGRNQTRSFSEIPEVKKVSGKTEDVRKLHLPRN